MKTLLKMHSVGDGKIEFSENIRSSHGRSKKTLATTPIFYLFMVPPK